MVNLLRITGLLAVVLAGLVLAQGFGYVSVIGPAGTDEEAARKVLDSDGAVKIFRTRHGNKGPSSKDETPLLVQQAQLFSGIINPPEPVNRTPVSRLPDPRKARTPVGPIGVTAQFGLVGTSYCPSAPEESLAYIRLPGNEYQWVRQGSEVGHVVITEITKHSIVCSDGQRIGLEPIPETASVLETGSSTEVTTASAPGAGVGRSLRRPGERIGLPSPPPPADDSRSRMNGKDEEELGKLVDRLRDLQKTMRSDKIGSQVDPADRAAMMKELISEYKSSRVSDEEAEKLEDLGKQLNGTPNPKGPSSKPRPTPPPSRKR